MCRYVGPVVFLAVLLNITKFFEAYVVHNDDGKILLRVSSIRKDPLYSAISKWIRLFILGIFPFGIILYLNFKVYMKLCQRSKNHNSSFQNARIPDTNDIQVCTSPLVTTQYTCRFSAYFYFREMRKQIFDFLRKM